MAFINTAEGDTGWVGSRPHIADARFASLEFLKSLLPDLIIAIPIETVCALTALSESTVWGKCDVDNERTYDPKFPQPRRYDGLKRTVWNLQEVQSFLQVVFSAPPAQIGAKGKKQVNRRGAK